MPTRCKHCSKIMLRPEPHEDCPNKDACDFETVNLLHFVSPNGEFKTVGQGSVTSRGQEGQEVVAQVPLKLHCKTVATPAPYSNVACAVTCPACIATFPPEIEEEVEE